MEDQIDVEDLERIIKEGALQRKTKGKLLFCFSTLFFTTCIQTNLFFLFLFSRFVFSCLNALLHWNLCFQKFKITLAINETLHAKPGEKEVAYKEEKAEQWSNTVMDKCLAKLAGRESKYKYSVSCVLMQKNGAGLVTSSSQYWEKNDSDLYVPVPWENNTIHCIVTIFVRTLFIICCFCLL